MLKACWCVSAKLQRLILFLIIMRPSYAQMLSEQLLEKLQERVGGSGEVWNPSQKLGDIFIQLGPFFKVYKEYVKNFEDASAYLLQMRAEYPLFAQLLDQLRETQGNMDVASFLVMPVQRMPRYKVSSTSTTPRSNIQCTFKIDNSFCYADVTGRISQDNAARASGLR